MRLALLVALLVAAPAAAQPSKKEELLADKQQAAPVNRTAWRKQLVRLVGKPAAPLLNLRNIWTRETLAFEPRPGMSVADPVLAGFLRCHFTNQPTRMDNRLFGVLVAAALHFKARRIDIVSGFRAPKYNLILRKKGHEVARDSQHTQGNAVDFRIPGVATPTLLGWARKLRLGGVGFYPHSQFVHVDTGPVRYWEGR